MKDKSDTKLRYTKYVPKWLPDAEKRAQSVAGEFIPLTQKLAALKPQIEAVRADFKKLKGSQTIMGCRYFKQFCETKLHRSEQAVYAMLGDYSKSKKDSDKQSEPQKPTMQQTPDLANEDVERMRTGLNAARRFFDAAGAHDKAKAEEAMREFLDITKAESLKSAISGDLPNPKLLLIQLLGMVEKLAETDPQALLRHARAIGKRIGMGDTLFIVDPTDPMPPTPAPIAAVKGKARAA